MMLGITGLDLKDFSYVFLLTSMTAMAALLNKP
jgi:hypothetical protein